MLCGTSSLPLHMSITTALAFVAGIPPNVWGGIAFLLTAGFVFAGTWVKARVAGKALVATAQVKAEKEGLAAVEVQRIKTAGEKETAIAVARIKAKADVKVALIKAQSQEAKVLTMTVA
jgi:hypothetical protein